MDARTSDRSGFGGHPRGLAPLFFTEMWERFSYYGMRAILVLYMVAPVAQGGLGFDTKRAASIYGTYTMAVYLTAMPGGLIADRLLGLRVGGARRRHRHRGRALLDGVRLDGVVLRRHGPDRDRHGAAQAQHQRHWSGVFYGENDPRRDSGFSLFYMGINIGAVLAPLVCGYLAQGAGFKSLVAGMGFDPSTSWHWGFGAAGVGMTLGLFDLRCEPTAAGPRGGARPSPRARTAGGGDSSAPRSRRGLEAHRRHLRLFPVHDPVLGGLRAEGSEPQPVRPAARARRDLRPRVFRRAGCSR